MSAITVVSPAIGWYNVIVKNLEQQLDTFLNAFSRKKHNRALRDILELLKAVEDFLIKYRLRAANPDFKVLLENLGRARIDIVEIAHLAGKTIEAARSVQSKDLQPLLKQLSDDLEGIKRGLFTRAILDSGLDKRITTLHNSLENLLAAVSAVEYR